ncbi:MAG: hypothetical protein ABSD75_20100 [Terriglobales bacterium]
MASRDTADRVRKVRGNDRVSPGEFADPNASRLTWAAVLLSLASFFYYVRQGDLLLYGDAVAHINIARRVFDSRTPGLLQLGTVWLPLPHLLMIPFIFPNKMWQNGTGGSVASMGGYVLGVLGIFRLVRRLLEAEPGEKAAGPRTVFGAWAAALAYGANPNLLYMQTTAMTESVYLALFIWAVAYFAEFIRALPVEEDQAGGRMRAVRISLSRCAWCLAGAELTRYDGWFLAGVMGTVVMVLALGRWRDRVLRRIAAKFLVGIALAPVLWLAYNRVVYGNALDFANGPYSAKAIEQRVAAPNPALHNAPVAAIYYLKSAQLNMAEGNWGRWWLAAACVALGIGVGRLRRQGTVLLLLWVPLVFYALSIAYGSVPLHVHTWWPFATFNQRYGLQLLPMFAASAGVLTASVFRLRAVPAHSGKLVAALLAVILVSDASLWRAEPQCLQEARRNWEIRNPLNSAVERMVVQLPRNSRFLMDLGEHVGIMQTAGIPLRQVVNNENHRPWKRPLDPDGLWERALADPAHYVDFVIAFDGDPVDEGANKSKLTVLAEFHATGQPRARIYARQTVPNQPR